MSSTGFHHNLFFIPAVPLIATHPQTPSVSPRRPPCMSSGDSAPPPSNGGGNFMGRFREFTFQGGDAVLQDDLVREVMWQAARTATTETMESAIQDEIDAVTENLSDMYSKGERNLRSRHEELARRESLPNISKWNQTLIESHKMSKESLSEIDKELAIVDELLRRNRRAQKRRRRAPGLRSRRVSDRGGMNLDGVKEALGPSSTPGGLLFTAIVCTVALDSFEKIAAQPNGPSNLAKYAAMSALVVLMTAHLHAVRAASRAANGELRGPNATSRHSTRE